jgi:hypothetical protein
MSFVRYDTSIFFKMHLNCNLTKIGKRNQLGILYCNMINKFNYYTKRKNSKSYNFYKAK